MTVNGSNAVQNSAHRFDMTCGPYDRKRLWGFQILLERSFALLRSGFRVLAPTPAKPRESVLVIIEVMTDPNFSVFEFAYIPLSMFILNRAV